MVVSTERLDFFALVVDANKTTVATAQMASTFNVVVDRMVMVTMVK